MIRDVDLVSYLPPFLAEFTENTVALEAENPEFYLVWEAIDRILKNEFIATADEQGLARFESLLHIYPSSEDTLETRRSRVQARWFNTIPYTWRVLLERLALFCAEHGFSAQKYFEEEYRIELEVELERYGDLEALEQFVENMVPANLLYHTTNRIKCSAQQTDRFGGGIVVTEFVSIKEG